MGCCLEAVWWQYGYLWTSWMRWPHANLPAPWGQRSDQQKKHKRGLSQAASKHWREQLRVLYWPCKLLYTIIPCAKAVTSETWEPSPEGRDGESINGETRVRAMESVTLGQMERRRKQMGEKVTDEGIEWQGKSWWWGEGVERQLLTCLCHSAWSELGWCTIWDFIYFFILAPHTSPVPSCSHLTPPPHPVFVLSLFYFPPSLCHRFLGKMTSHQSQCLIKCHYHFTELPFCACVRAGMSVMSLPLLAGAEDLPLWGLVSQLFEKIRTKKRGEGVRESKKRR